MSCKERRRLEILSRVRDGDLSIVAASKVMKLSVRQGRRVWNRLVAEGDSGLVHKLRGRTSNHALSCDLKQKVLKRYRGAVRGLWPDAGIGEVGGGGAGGGP